MKDENRQLNKSDGSIINLSGDDKVSSRQNTAIGKTAFKSGIWYTVGNFLSKGAVFLTMPVFTRLMTKNDVGLFSNFSSWLSILCVITTFELFSSVALAKYEYKDNMDDFISSNLLLGSLITLVFYLICLSCKTYVLDILSFSELEFHIAFLYLLVCPAMQMFQIRSRIFYKYKISVLFSVLSVLLSTAMSLLLVFLLSDKYLGRYIGFIAPLIAFNFVIYIFFLCKGHKIKLKYWKFALVISFPLIWHTLSGTLLSSSDRVMINNMIGPDANALYSVAYTCSSVVSVLWTSMNTAWSPWAYDQMETGSFDALKKASKPYIFFFGVVVFGFLLIAPELLWIMGGSDYLDALSVIPPVMTACVFQFIYSLYVNIEFYYKKQVLTAVGTVIAAVVNIGLNYIFIPQYGYIAAAYTTLAGYIVLFFIHFIIAARLKKSFFYDTKFNLFFLLCSICVMFGMILLYSYNIVRYIFVGVLLVCFAIVIVVFRKEIKHIIKYKSLDALREKLKKKRDNKKAITTNVSVAEETALNDQAKSLKETEGKAENVCKNNNESCD